MTENTWTRYIHQRLFLSVLAYTPGCGWDCSDQTSPSLIAVRERELRLRLRPSHSTPTPSSLPPRSAIVRRSTPLHLSSSSSSLGLAFNAAAPRVAAHSSAAPTRLGCGGHRMLRPPVQGREIRQPGERLRRPRRQRGDRRLQTRQERGLFYPVRIRGFSSLSEVYFDVHVAL